MDQIERLRGLARLDWPEEVPLLVSTLTDAERDRLGDCCVRAGRWSGGVCSGAWAG